MKRTIALLTILGIFGICIPGCGEKTTSKTETKVTTPGGETTVTTEKSIKQTGDNPPPARP